MCQQARYGAACLSALTACCVRQVFLRLASIDLDETLRAHLSCCDAPPDIYVLIYFFSPIICRLVPVGGANKLSLLLDNRIYRQLYNRRGLCEVRVLAVGTGSASTRLS